MLWTPVGRERWEGPPWSRSDVARVKGVGFGEQEKNGLMEKGS